MTLRRWIQMTLQKQRQQNSLKRTKNPNRFTFYTTNSGFPIEFEKDTFIQNY